MRRALLLLAPATLSLAAAAAADPVPPLDPRGFHAPTDPASGLYVQPVEAPATGQWNVGVFTSYAYRPIALQGIDVIRHQVSSDVVLGVGLWKRLHLGVDLPVVVYQTGDTPTTATAIQGYALPAQAFGDLGIDARVTLVHPTGGELGGFGLALHERFTVPTGDTGSFLGEGVPASETRVLAEYRIAGVGVHAAAGFKVRGHTESLASTRIGDELPFGLGVSLLPQKLGIDDGGRMVWFVEMNGHLPAGPIAPFQSSSASSVQGDAAVRVQVGHDVSVLAGISFGLLGGVGDAPVRAVVAVSWAPRTHDRDGDGIPDEIDHCPDLPEDFDGFQDHDGCPELDNDGDGIPDRVDLCPNEPEDFDGYQDADGCPDPDNDGDHILDVDDACPNEPGPPDPDPKKNGCPSHDQDGDGIPDEKDACPTEPGVKNADPRLNGCPPGKDTDGDGIPDAEDACPTVKGVRSEIPRENGCPDPDPDKDTYIGDEDKCPDAAETWNGYQDADGCPDEAPQKTPPIVSVRTGPKGTVLEVTRAVSFTAAGEVDPTGLLTLRAVASELVKHPTWRIKVGVHASPRLDERAAAARAEAVVAALRRFARRPNAAEIVPWPTVKDAPRAAEHGVGFVLLLPAEPPAKR
jgi:OmpA-OmpF porin, OOP family